LGDAEIDLIASLSSGDARRALNTLELVAQMAPAGPDGIPRPNVQTIRPALERQPLVYDKGDEQHYNLRSAQHKNLSTHNHTHTLSRLARLLEAGEHASCVARQV